jgi:hypothetical protein
MFGKKTNPMDFYRDYIETTTTRLGGANPNAEGYRRSLAYLLSQETTKEGKEQAFRSFTGQDILEGNYASSRARQEQRKRVGLTGGTDLSINQLISGAEASLSFNDSSSPRSNLEMQASRAYEKMMLTENITKEGNADLYYGSKKAHNQLEQEFKTLFFSVGEDSYEKMKSDLVNKIQKSGFAASSDQAEQIINNEFKSIEKGGFGVRFDKSKTDSLFGSPFSMYFVQGGYLQNSSKPSNRNSKLVEYFSGYNSAENRSERVRLTSGDEKRYVDIKNKLNNPEIVTKISRELSEVGNDIYGRHRIFEKYGILGEDGDNDYSYTNNMKIAQMAIQDQANGFGLNKAAKDDKAFKEFQGHVIDDNKDWSHIRGYDSNRGKYASEVVYAAHGLEQIKKMSDKEFNSWIIKNGGDFKYNLQALLGPGTSSDVAEKVYRGLVANPGGQEGRAAMAEKIEGLYSISEAIKKDDVETKILGEDKNSQTLDKLANACDAIATVLSHK